MCVFARVQGRSVFYDTSTTELRTFDQSLAFFAAWMDAALTSLLYHFYEFSCFPSDPQVEEKSR